MKKRSILLTLIVAAGLAAFGPGLNAQTSSRSSLEAKLALENSLEKRVRMVLSEALGTEDIIVIISAELQEQEKKSAEIMPGIPEKDKMGEPSLSSTLTMVKKLSASLILDKSVSEEDTQLARKLAAGLLGLPPERQDLVSVEKMNFRKTRPLTFADLFLPPNLWSLAWLLVVGLLALFTVSAFLSPLTKSAKAFVEAFSAKAAAGAETAGQEYRAERQEKETPAAQQAAARPAGAEAGGRKPPFWFLNAGSAQSLAFILKTRPTEDLTIVLNYAPQDLAARLAEALHPRSAEALAALPRVTLMSEARIKALEAEVLAALDYVVGGEDKALEILNNMDEAAQEKALAAFGRIDPAMSRKLNSSVVKLSDVAALDQQQALTLARRVPMRALAAALKGSPHAETFASRLSGGMQERFRQELDLTRPLAADGYKAERAKVVDALRQLIREGFITLGHHAPAKAAHPPAGARPAAAPGPKPAAAPAPAAAAAPAPAPAPAAAPKP